MKIAIITGASSGIGREFVRQADALHFDELWVIARREERLGELKSVCKTPVRPIAMDLTKGESLQRLKALLEDITPDVGLLVNASGFGKYGTYRDLTDREIDDMIDVNNKAMVHMSCLALQYMKEGAGIINMGSASAFQPLPYFNLYASTKAFVKHFSRALHVELRDRKITVTCVCPGYVRTEFFEVAQDTKNPDTCQNFKPMYEPEDVVRKALKDNKKGKDMSVLGFTTKFRAFFARIVPARLTFAVWLKIK